jgi:hypothetical protein
MLPSGYYLVPKPQYLPLDPSSPLAKELETMQLNDAVIKSGNRTPEKIAPPTPVKPKLVSYYGGFSN